MPSRVVKALNTNVNAAGNCRGTAACPEKRSCPIFALSRLVSHVHVHVHVHGGRGGDRKDAGRKERIHVSTISY